MSTSPINKLIKRIFLKFYFMFTARKKRFHLKKNGLLLMSELHRILCEENIIYFFDMGTLLGIIRNSTLIRHDTDLDIAILQLEYKPTDFIRRMQNHGFIVDSVYYVGDRIVEISLKKSGIKVDFNFYYTENEHYICYLLYSDPQKEYKSNELNVVKLYCDKFAGTKLLELSGIKIQIPSEPEKYLEQRYGENWRIPDKKWVYWKGPSAKIIDEIGYFYRKSEFAEKLTKMED